jgi:acylphosphatase
MAENTVLVRYFGMVQGVGFRATTRRLAQGYAVRGWVKNESDGSVSMIATAEARELDAFLRALRESRLGNLIEREVVEPCATPEGSGFEVKR